MIHFIGVGTFGDVHCVKHLVSGGYYAVKRSKRRFASAGDRDKMLVEVQTMAELAQNEHIVQYYSCWTEDHHVYVLILLMLIELIELCHGYLISLSLYAYVVSWLSYRGLLSSCALESQCRYSSIVSYVLQYY